MPDQHTELRRLADAATPGPWHVDLAGEHNDRQAIIAGALREKRGRNALDFGEDHATARFVAAARTTLPALLDEIDELTDALAAVVQQRNEIARDRKNMAEIIAGLERELGEAGQR